MSEDEDVDVDTYEKRLRARQRFWSFVAAAIVIGLALLKLVVATS